MQQREPILAHGLILRVHQNFIEEQIDLRAKCGDDFEAARDGPAPDCTRSRCLERKIEFGFGSAFEQLFVQRVRLAFETGLPQDVADAFEAGSQRFEVLGGPHGPDGFEAFGEIHQIVPVRREDGIDFVVLEALDFAEIVADALGDKVFERL